MPELVADCPRCRTNSITFELRGELWTGREFKWRNWYEAFCVCRHCRCGTIFVLCQKDINRSAQDGGLRAIQSTTLNEIFEVKGFINIKDFATISPPDDLPKDIEAAFKEGAKCLAVECYNAAATMFRLCLDVATRSIVPKENVAGLDSQTRRNLGRRLKWLFANDYLPSDLRDLSQCIKEDGDDGAHAGTLTANDVEDLLDFTSNLLHRFYTEPARIKAAQLNREQRRARNKGPNPT